MMNLASMKYWFFLFGAVFFEVIGTSVMKMSQISGWILSANSGLIAMFVLIGLSYYCLSLSVRGLPVGVAFAFWEGLGLILITAVSVLAMGEAMTLPKFVALLAILGGAILIHRGTGHGETGNSGDTGDRTSTGKESAMTGAGTK